MKSKKELIKERWKVINDEECSGMYKVSNHGRIKSVTRYINIKRSDGISYNRVVKSKELRTGRHEGLVSLPVMCKNSITGKLYKSTKYVHKEVAKAFIKNPDPSIYVNVEHKDGDKENNAVWNLRWITLKDSSQKSLKSRSRESLDTLKNYNLKKSIGRNLSPEVKRSIIYDYCVAGLVYRELKDKYKYSITVLHGVVNGKYD